MTPAELSLQLKKPAGSLGREIALELNESNRGLYELAFELVDFKANTHILEIGFGNGKHFPKYFESQPHLKVTGVDYSKDMCEEATAHNPNLIQKKQLAVYCTDISSLPFPDEKFDLAIAINVIYFLEPAEIHLKEISRVLKPGGHFLIGYRPRHAVEHLEFTKQNFILYESPELTSLLNHNGFEIVKEENKSSQKSAVDGTEFTVTDSCILASKTS